MRVISTARWNLDMSSDERRTEILRSLGAVLRERHASSLTMQDIAGRLGMTKGNLYHYFRNKQEILFQCHLKSTEDSLRLLDEAKKGDGTPALRLAMLIEALVEAVIIDPYGAIATTDLHRLSTPQRRAYIALRDRFEQGVRSLIQEGVRSGQFETSDVKLTGLAMLGAINSVSRWYDAKGPRKPAEVAAAFAHYLVRGLIPQTANA